MTLMNQDPRTNKACQDPASKKQNNANGNNSQQNYPKNPQMISTDVKGSSNSTIKTEQTQRTSTPAISIPKCPTGQNTISRKQINRSNQFGLRLLSRQPSDNLHIEDPTASMTTPAKKNIKNKEHVNRKTDKIINTIFDSPTKQQQENEQQLISIIPAENTSPTVQLIAIIPAHQSTPVEPTHYITATTTQENPKDNTAGNNQLVTHKRSSNTNSENTIRNNQLAQQTTKDNNSNDQQDTQTSHRDVPEERQYNVEPTEIVHMEEDNCDTATLSSISSLNTEDITAPDKLFD